MFSASVSCKEVRKDASQRGGQRTGNRAEEERGGEEEQQRRKVKIEEETSSWCKANLSVDVLAVHLETSQGRNRSGSAKRIRKSSSRRQQGR